MSERAGMINEYVCEKCKGITRTVNRDEGVTPFTMRCRASPAGCDGHAISAVYQCSQNMRPDWEWIAPTSAEFEDWIDRHHQKEYRDQLKAHVAQGGMLLQKLDAIGRERYGFKTRRA